MQFKTIATYLSLFLSISVSTLAFVSTDEVYHTETYSLTLSTDPTKLLASASERLVVQTFVATEPWNAADVGPDNGRRWTFMAEMEGVTSFETPDTNSLAYLDGELVTSSPSWWGGMTKIRLVPAEGGFKIQTVGDGDQWVNDFGKVDGNNAAIWMISLTTPKEA